MRDRLARVSLLDRLRRLGRPESKAIIDPQSPYRREVEEDPSDVIDQISARMAAQALRIRALEHRLGEFDGHPLPTGSGRDLLEAAEVLTVLSRGDHPTQNTVALRMLAESLRALARYEG